MVLLHGGMHGPEFAGADGTPDPDRSRFSHYQGCLSVTGWVPLLRKPSEILRSGTKKCIFGTTPMECTFIYLNLVGYLGLFGRAPTPNSV